MNNFLKVKFFVHLGDRLAEKLSLSWLLTVIDEALQPAHRPLLLNIVQVVLQGVQSLSVTHLGQRHLVCVLVVDGLLSNVSFIPALFCGRLLVTDNGGHQLVVEGICRVGSQHHLDDEKEGVKQTTAVSQPVQQPIGRPVNNFQVTTKADLHGGVLVESVGVLRGRELVPSTRGRCVKPSQPVEEVFHLFAQLNQLGLILKERSADFQIDVGRGALVDLLRQDH